MRILAGRMRAAAVVVSLALVAVVAVFSAGFLLVPRRPPSGLRHMTSRPAPVGLECADEARS